jgi:glucokinase
MGEVAGDACAQAVTLFDSLVVVGGGISAAHPLFLQPLVDAMNDVFPRDGAPMHRLIPRAFNLEDPAQCETFLRGSVKETVVPGSGRVIRYDPLQRTGVGLSRLGTSEAVSIGAYAFALSQLG